MYLTGKKKCCLSVSEISSLTIVYSNKTINNNYFSIFTVDVRFGACPISLFPFCDVKINDLLYAFHYTACRSALHALLVEASTSLRKQPTFRDATTGFPTKWRLRNEHRNSILMTRHYRDLDSASDWLKQISHAPWPIRSTTQIWVVPRHKYGISALSVVKTCCIVVKN